VADLVALTCDVDTSTRPECRLLERSTHSAEDRFVALTARLQGRSSKAAQVEGGPTLSARRPSQKGG
jgi:hypothetical protein